MKWRLSWLLVFLPLAVNGIEPGGDNPLLPGMLVWRCWYDQRVHITCLVDSLPRGGTEMAPSSRLPAIVRQLRSNPEIFRSRFVHIPLYTEPYDMGFAAMLARATVCGSRPDCRVNFSASPPSPLEMEGLFGSYPPAAGSGGTEALPDAGPEEPE